MAERLATNTEIRAKEVRLIGPEGKQVGIVPLKIAIDAAKALEMDLVEVAVGLRPGTPDNAPLIGPAGDDRLLIATGHFRNGILLAPVTARAIEETLATGAPPDEIAPFSPQRFGAREVVA